MYKQEEVGTHTREAICNTNGCIINVLLVLLLVIQTYYSIVFATAYVIINSTYNYQGDCSCNTYIDVSGFGNCEKVKVEGDRSGPICFVNKPSTCNDVLNATGIYYSWEACNIEKKTAKTISEHNSITQLY